MNATPESLIKEYADPIEQQEIDKFICSEMSRQIHRQYRLWSWISNYYMSPLGDVYNAAMPAGMKSAEKFKPRMELYVELTSKYRNEASLHVALNMLQRALKQSKALTTFLSLSHWDSLENDTPREGIKKVTKEELMNEAHCTSAIVKSLIDRDILFTYEEEVGRHQ